MLLFSVENNNNGEDGEINNRRRPDEDRGEQDHSRRRSFLGMAAPWLAQLSTLAADPPPATARGLVMFPCTTPLLNTYHLMRTGTSLLEEENIWSTNPLSLTSREAGLSSAGEDQVRKAAKQLKSSKDSTATIIKYSLAASSMDGAKLVAREINLGVDRVIPEFTFLDPRAIGRWDMLALADTQAAVWAMDADEAGRDGLQGRPPPNDDGTPNETLADQAVRLRQVMSVLETFYSGESILLVFPDGTGPALLSAMIAGIPFKHVHEIEFESGEMRLDVTLESTKQLWSAKKEQRRRQQQKNDEMKKENSASSTTTTTMTTIEDNKNSANDNYDSTLQRGRRNLKELRAIPESDEIVSVKDAQLDQERVEMERQLVEKKKEDTRRREEQQARDRLEQQKQEINQARKAERSARQKQFVDNSKEKKATAETTRQKQAKYKEEKRQRIEAQVQANKLEREQQKQKRQRMEAQVQASKLEREQQKQKQQQVTAVQPKTGSSNFDLNPFVWGSAVVGLAGIGIVAAMGGEMDGKDEEAEATMSPPPPPSSQEEQKKEKERQRELAAAEAIKQQQAQEAEKEQQRLAEEKKRNEELKREQEKEATKQKWLAKTEALAEQKRQRLAERQERMDKVRKQREKEAIDAAEKRKERTAARKMSPAERIRQQANLEREQLRMARQNLYDETTSDGPFGSSLPPPGPLQQQQPKSPAVKQIKESAEQKQDATPQEYPEEDDGWLQSIAAIMVEDDDNDIPVE